MSDKTPLGDRMKVYERTETGRTIMPMLPTLARMDGKAFHTFTRGLPRPFCDTLRGLMVETTRRLVEETNANVGYTQSDEITLLWHTPDPKTQPWMGGRVMKMTSILAAMTTAIFNRLLPEYLPGKAGALPLFDARVWNVPTPEEAANVFVWREQDAVRNSVSMLAQAHFSPKRLHGLSGAEMQELLWQEKGINWNDTTPQHKRGVYVQRRRVVTPFSTKELERLPAKHAARTNPDLAVERWRVEPVCLPPLTKVTNRVAVLFEGATAMVAP